MLKFPKSAALAVLALAAFAGPSLADGDIGAGEKVFKKCKACHAVGDGAKHRVGPELNDLFGRTAGGAEGYKYSKAMIEAGEGGLVWGDATLAEYLTKPKAMIKGTKMAFAGLKKEDDIANLTAYLKTFSAEEAAAAEPAAEEPAMETAAAETPEPAVEASAMAVEKSTGAFGLGRTATPDGNPAGPSTERCPPGVQVMSVKPITPVWSCPSMGSGTQ